MIRLLDQARLALLRAARHVGIFRRRFLRPGEAFPGSVHQRVCSALLDAEAEAAR